MVRVHILVEEPTDEPVARCLLRYVGLERGTIYGEQGKASERFPKYNDSAQFSPAG